MKEQFTSTPSLNIEHTPIVTAERPIDWAINDASIRALFHQERLAAYKHALREIRTQRKAKTISKEKARDLMAQLDELTKRSLEQEISKLSPDWAKYKELDEYDQCKGGHAVPIILEDGRIYVSGDWSIPTPGIFNPDNNFDFTPLPDGPHINRKFASFGNKVSIFENNAADDIATIQEYDLVSGAARSVTFELFSDQSSLAYMPDGRIVTYLEDGTIHICDLDDQANPIKQTFRTEIDQPMRSSLDITVDGKIVASGDHEVIIVIDPIRGPNPEQWVTIPTTHWGVPMLALPDGRIVIDEDEELNFKDINSGEEIGSLPIPNTNGVDGFSVNDMILSPDGTLIVGCSGTPAQYQVNCGPIFLIDSHTQQLIKQLPGHEFSIEKLALLPDNRIVSTDNRGIMKVWGLKK